MTKRVTASAAGLNPHFKVRITIPNALLHLASWTKPAINKDENERVAFVVADWIDDPEHGDTPAFIDWTAVTAITYRWSA